MAIDRPLQQAARPVALSEFPPLFKHLQLWTLSFFGASLAFHLFQRFHLHRWGHSVFPYSLNTHDRFLDFTVFTDKFRYIHTARFFQVGFPINYPAPVAFVFDLFFRYARPHEVVAFVTFSVIAFLIPAWLFGVALVRRGLQPAPAFRFVAILCLFSWPAALIVDGANAEVLVWIVTALGMTFFATNRGYPAAFFFGLAASLKLFPIVFLGLFLFRGQIGKLLSGVASFFAVSVLALGWLGPDIPTARAGIAYGLAQFQQGYMAHWYTNEHGVDHSLFACVKFVLFYGFHHSDDFTPLLRLYLPLSAVGGILLYVFAIHRAPLLNQVLLLSIASIYLTAFSGDGTLIHLYYPLAMLLLLALRAWQLGVAIPGLSAALGCIAFCVSVTSFFVVSHRDVAYRYIGPMHAVSLGLLLVIGLRFRFGPPVAAGYHPGVLSHPDDAWLRSFTLPLSRAKHR